jgi:hypothetical protein
MENSDNTPIPIVQANTLFEGFPHPWMIAGGWAIDLFLGIVRRQHKDVDIAIFRQDQLALQEHIRGWQVYKADAGKLEPWAAGDYIEPPIHTIWAWRPGRPAGDVRGQPDLEFLFDERDATHWLFRRDPRITRPLAKACLTTRAGIPFLAPEIVLLYKSKESRPEDHDDFGAVHGALNSEQRAWLSSALSRTLPDHEWLAYL